MKFRVKLRVMMIFFCFTSSGSNISCSVVFKISTPLLFFSRFSLHFSRITYACIIKVSTQFVNTHPTTTAMMIQPSVRAKSGGRDSSIYTVQKLMTITKQISFKQSKKFSILVLNGFASSTHTLNISERLKLNTSCSLGIDSINTSDKPNKNLRMMK